MKRVRAAVLKHGRYSVIEREVAAWVQAQQDFRCQQMSSMRSRFMRQVYAQAVARRPMSAQELEKIRDAVIAGRLTDL